MPDSRPDSTDAGTAHPESPGSGADEHFRELLESSSLGTPAARRIRASAPPDVVGSVRRRLPKTRAGGQTVGSGRTDCSPPQPPHVDELPACAVQPAAAAPPSKAAAALFPEFREEGLIVASGADPASAGLCAVPRILAAERPRSAEAVPRVLPAELTSVVPGWVREYLDAELVAQFGSRMTNLLARIPGILERDYRPTAPERKFLESFASSPADRELSPAFLLARICSDDSPAGWESPEAGRTRLALALRETLLAVNDPALRPREYRDSGSAGTPAAGRNAVLLSRGNREASRHGGGALAVADHEAERLQQLRSFHELVSPGREMLYVTRTPASILLAGEADEATREEFAAMLRTLAGIRPPEGRPLILDLSKLSFLDARCIGEILQLAAGLPAPQRLEVRCLRQHRRMLNILGSAAIPQLTIITCGR